MFFLIFVPPPPPPTTTTKRIVNDTVILKKSMKKRVVSDESSIFHNRYWGNPELIYWYLHEYIFSLFYCCPVFWPRPWILSWFLKLKVIFNFAKKNCKPFSSILYSITMKKIYFQQWIFTWPSLGSKQDDLTFSLMCISLSHFIPNVTIIFSNMWNINRIHL